MNPWNLAISCVVDRGAQFQLQNFYLVNSLISQQEFPPQDIYVHYIEGVREAYLSYLANLGINLVEIEPFDEDNRYLNKLRQVQSDCWKSYQDVAFLDNDLFFCEAIDFNLIKPQAVAAKVVDLSNPPLHVLEAVYRHFNISFSDKKLTESVIKNESTEFTAHNNCNGGFYLFNTSFLAKFSETWLTVARQLLEQPSLLREYAIHTDQVSFAVALDLIKVKVEHLEVIFNFPTHLELAMDSCVVPSVLHYHRNLDANQFLQKTGLASVDNRIEQANCLIREFRRQSFQNFIFWDYRYCFNPELGSGVGSRGEFLNQKSTLLGKIAELFSNLSVLEVGCGDLEVSSKLSFSNYIGIDLSKYSIELAAKKRPDWTFINTSIDAFSLNSFDIVICLDVLLHQPKEDLYFHLLEAIVQRCGRYLLISGYVGDSEFKSDITFYYGSLYDHLRQFEQVLSIESLLEYRGHQLFACQLGDRASQNCISVSQLLWLDSACNQAQSKILKRLIELDYKEHGKLTYAQLDLIKSILICGYIAQLEVRSVVQIEPDATLKLYLTKRRIQVADGLDVATVTRSDALCFNITFLNEPPKKFLGAYKALLRSEGFLILTANLVAGTDAIQKEAASMESSVCSILDLLNALTDLGFRIVEKTYLRDIPGSSIDVCCIVAQKTMGRLDQVIHKIAQRLPSQSSRAE